MTIPTLYHCKDARSLRCLWAVEETGFACDVVTMPFPPHAFAPEYKAINPLATIPGWVEDGVLLTESAAICQRVAMGTPLELVPGDADYLPYLNWLHRSDATLAFPLAIMMRYTVVERPERRLAQAVEDYKLFFLGRAKSVEVGLVDGRDWLVGERFTIADICVGYALFLADRLGIGGDMGDASRAYLARLVERPRFITARARQAETADQKSNDTRP